MDRIRLLVPGNIHHHSGGNIYNARLVQGLKALGVRRLSAGSSLSEAAFGLLRTRAGAFLKTGEAAGLGEGAMPYPEINGIMRTA